MTLGMPEPAAAEPCKWTGVACDRGSYTVDLRKRGLRGRLVPLVRELKSLRSLVLVAVSLTQIISRIFEEHLRYDEIRCKKLEVKGATQ